MSRITIVPISVSPDWNSVTTESVTRLSSASTSLVMREISTPGGPRLVEADRQRLQVAEDPDAQVGERALADPADQVGLHVGHHPHQQRRDQERDDDQHERSGVVLVDALVDRDFREQRRRERRRGADDQSATIAMRARRGRGGAARAARAGCARACPCEARSPVHCGARRAAPPGPRPTDAGSQAAHLRGSAARASGTPVGQALLDDFAVQLGALEQLLVVAAARARGRARARRSRRRARSSTGGGR